MNSERPIDFAELHQIAQLRHLLRQVEYSQEGIRELTGFPDLRHLNREQMEDVRGRLERGGKLGALTALLYLGLPLGNARFEQAIAPMTPAEWSQAGMVELNRDRVEAKVLLMPYGPTVFAADRPPQLGCPMREDYVMDVGGGTSILSALAVRRPVNTTADLGTGCGLLAMQAAAYSRQVVAVDLNQRALDYARFNAALNDIDNIRWVCADLFSEEANFADEGFDHILCHPPFVVSPSTRLIYCDSPLEGDEVSRQAVQVSAKLLRENGFAQILVNWVHLVGRDWQVRLQSWFDQSGCDAWVMRSETRDRTSYAQMWLHDNRVQDDQALPEWLDYYDRLGIESISSGVITLRKRESSHHWFRLDDSPTKMMGPAGHHVVRIVEAQNFLEGKSDDALVDVRLRPPNDLRLEQQLIPGPDGWHIGTCRSYLQSGLGYQLNHDAQIAHLITNSDGNTRLRDVIGAYASQGGLPAESVSRSALHAAKLLLRYGLMLPAA
jgi:SAM-dependent methyltransferase